MIYDTPIVILRLPNTTGTLIQGDLERVFSAYCRELEVYHTRFWEAVQAGSRIDYLVELPLHRKTVSAGLFAQYGGHIYSIEQIQFGRDRDGLPITTLSLKRPEDFYDIAAV